MILFTFLILLPIKDVFPDSTSYFTAKFVIKNIDEFNESVSPVRLTVEEREIEGCEIWSETVIGWCFYVNEIGKELPITFLIFISSEIKVMYIEVTKYRETRGGEIRSSLFLKQYKGKGISDKIDEGIKNIRGATLSAFATSRAVKKALTIATFIKNGKADIIRLQRFTVQKHQGMKRSFHIGDSFLSLSLPDAVDEVRLKEIEIFAENLSKEIDNFYYRGILSYEIESLIFRAKKKREETSGFFDIFWRKNVDGIETPDLGGIWKGYVVDRFSNFLKDRKIKNFFINFGESTYALSGPTEVKLFDKILNGKEPISISVSDGSSEYSQIFDPVNKRFIKSDIKVAIIHKSAEFADFASTLCVIWRDCENYVKSKGGEVIFE